MTPFAAFRLHAPTDNGPPAGRLETLTLDDLSPGDVVIRVAYSSLNYKDALAAAGLGKIVRAYPRIGGIDLTGHVVSSTCPDFKNGDEVVVHGFGTGVDHDGGHAQYARVRAEWVLPLPKGISLLDACTIGAAGFTAALSLHWMEHCGLTPDAGAVVVTGATGGVGSVAIDLLSQRGYDVCAVTGKSHSADFLRQLGAGEIIDAPTSGPVAALTSARWAGAIDAVGGPTLAWLLSAIKPEGVVAAFGNAGGVELATTVFPFILRGVKLLGINANSPMPLRREIWEKLSTTYRPAHLDTLRHIIDLPDVPQALDAMLARSSRGRCVIRMHTTT